MTRTLVARTGTQRLLANVLLAAALAIALPGCAKIEDQVFKVAIGAEHLRAGLSPATVKVDDIDWVYLKNEWKDGRETVVLLHGFSADKDNWTRFAGAFGDGYNLVIPDLPGHGETTQDMKLAYDVDTQSRRVLSLMSALGVEKFHVAGNSMGGAIAVHTAWLAPARALTIGLFNPAGAKAEDSDFDAALKEGINPLIVKKPEDMERVIAYAMAKPPFMPWPVMNVMARRSMANAERMEKIFGDLRRDNGIDQTGILTDIPNRTLVLWGDQDRLLNVANADLFMASMANARKVIMPGIGHAPMLEVPEESAKIYRDFLAGQ